MATSGEEARVAGTSGMERGSQRWGSCGPRRGLLGEAGGDGGLDPGVSERTE